MITIDCYICHEPNQVLKPHKVRYGGFLNLTSPRTECTNCGSFLYCIKVENANIKFTKYVMKGMK
ncbi:hypothetical protein XaC1_528 [Xanthomonas phage XaC1]|nr:hypothetical protein XaC1_528 [Xanthomonas phage XaC1]